MDKKTFYITVNTGSIVEDKGDEGYEFEVMATDEEIDRLQELFEDTSVAEEATATRGMFMPVHTEAYNDSYDRYLVEVYQMLHELGTSETKRHIESMNVLNGQLS